MTNPRPTPPRPTASSRLPSDVVKRRKSSDEAAAPVQAAEPAPTAARGGYMSTLNAGIQATIARAQEMHQAISGKTFDSLGRVPGL